MQLMLNGEARQFSAAPETVEALLVTLGLPLARIAVELNGDIVTKGERPMRALKDGDVLEIVTLVGGG